MIARDPVSRAVPVRPYPTRSLYQLPLRPFGAVWLGAWSTVRRPPTMTLPSHLYRYLRRAHPAGSAVAAHRLSGMRVRRFELRLIAIALVVAWSVAAGLVLLAYRPGGPFDLVVGLTAMTPIAIALAGAIWPPVARGEHAFPAIVGLGIGALLCLVPSISGVVTQLLAYGSRTLLPSAEAAYPWLLALLATSLFSGIGVARRLSGGMAPRGPRLAGGVAIALFVTTLATIAFSAVAVANDLALRDTAVSVSRFGPTAGEPVPPLCDGPSSPAPRPASSCTCRERSTFTRSDRSTSAAGGWATISDGWRTSRRAASSGSTARPGSVTGPGPSSRERAGGRPPRPRSTRPR